MILLIFSNLLSAELIYIIREIRSFFEDLQMSLFLIQTKLTTD